jgi:hypothetical protein
VPEIAVVEAFATVRACMYEVPIDSEVAERLVVEALFKVVVPVNVLSPAKD